MNSKYIYVVCDRCNTRTQEIAGSNYRCSRCVVYGDYEIGYPLFTELKG